MSFVFRNFSGGHERHWSRVLHAYNHDAYFNRLLLGYVTYARREEDLLSFANCDTLVLRQARILRETLDAQLCAYMFKELGCPKSPDISPRNKAERSADWCLSTIDALAVALIADGKTADHIDGMRSQ
jgi:hypothetical protein